MAKELPIPTNEDERLKALQDYNVLDTLPEEEYDAITKLASFIAGTPIALVSLIDEDRQWFKSKVGLEAPETTRDISFCQYAIMDDTPYEVVNATENPIFKDNPLVTGDPNIRHYAGFPLKNPQGYNLGTLCVINSVPGQLSEDQNTALKTLANQVTAQLELRKQNHMLSESKKSLEKSNKQLDEFAYIVSHDLKAPLRAINSLSEWISDDIEEIVDDEVKNNLSLLRGRVMRMESLINGILEYSKIGKSKIEIESVKIRDLATDIFEILNTERKFKLVFTGESLEIKIQKIYLDQVLSNLISNAIKYYHNEDGGLIEVGAIEKIDRYQFYVKDNGPGIAKQYHDKIFKIFQTLESRDAKESTGIGLAIIKKILDENGGSITIDSEPGSGTKFSFDWMK